MPAKCPPGMIKRVAYSATRSSTGKSYSVPAVCVKDVGKPGKTPKSLRIDVDLSEVDLGTYGYKDVDTLSKTKRHDALKLAIVQIAKDKKDMLKPLKKSMDTNMSDAIEYRVALKIFKRLNLLAVLNKNTNPKLHTILLEDRDWVKETWDLGRATV